MKIVSTCRQTCSTGFGAPRDFFVMHHEIFFLVQEIALDPLTPYKPHEATQLKLTTRPRKVTMRIMMQPKSFPDPVTNKEPTVED